MKGLMYGFNQMVIVLSTQAKNCPRCGAKMPMSNSRKLIWELVFLTIILFISTIDDTNEENNQIDNQIKEKVSKEGQKIIWIDRGKQEVKNKFKDPESAEFKDVFLVIMEIFL